LDTTNLHDIYNYKVIDNKKILKTQYKELIKIMENKNNFEYLKYYIEHSINLDFFSPFGYQFIHYYIRCIKVPDISIIKLLVEKGINLESETKCYLKKRPIHLACEFSNCEFIKYLIDMGIDLECPDSTNFYPIHVACMFNKSEIIEYLINKGVNLEVTELLANSKPIHMACEKSSYEIVKLFIDKKVNLRSTDINPWEPIHWSCYNNDPRILKLLVDNNCDIESIDKRGGRPIHIACMNHKFGSLYNEELVSN
jgi:ankyrin repeat protein